MTHNIQEGLSMNTKERHIFAGGNTARGYRCFFDSVLAEMDCLFVLTGGVEGLASTLIKQIGDELAPRAGSVEWIHSPFVNGAFDGVIFSDLRAAVVDGSYPRVLQPRAPGLIESYVNLQAVIDTNRLAPRRNLIATWYEALYQKTQEAYEAFAQALAIHDEWEEIYISRLNREKANRVAEEVTELFFGEETLPKNARIRHMYLGAATPSGPVDHIANLTADIGKRYFIKGRPGSGKSTMLNKLVAEAKRRGFDAEVYHCGLDPNSLDMVILPEKSIAIFDSTAPHEYFPDRSSDEVIDMYARAIEPGTDEVFADQLAEIRGRYAAAMKKGTASLAEAQICRHRLADIYGQAADRDKVEAVHQSIVRELTARLA
jgi:hypothetical protein